MLSREHAEVQTDPRLPFDPDWDRLLAWAATGALDVWTTRADDELIGYVSVLFMPHLYSRGVALANVHTPYLAPEWRLGRLGIDMLKHLLVELKARGVDVVDIDIDKGSRVGGILKNRLAFDDSETRWRKWL